MKQCTVSLAINEKLIPSSRNFSVVMITVACPNMRSFLSDYVQWKAKLYSRYILIMWLTPFARWLQQTGDDIVYTRTQAKTLRKSGFTIPSYRVLPVQTEVLGRLGNGDRAVVAIGSNMIQNRWTKWRDEHGAFVVPFYFSSTFPG